MTLVGPVPFSELPKVASPTHSEEVNQRRPLVADVDEPSKVAVSPSQLSAAKSRRPLKDLEDFAPGADLSLHCGAKDAGDFAGFGMCSGFHV